ncbi:beta strand repeat-containing protein [Variovorax sp. DT-64]|uniref:beta strand repeat-containing protein n=1 Tax=Variovorax sp. DT-64 TaxID=3396160 RepID=UPI003F54180B
MGSATNADGNSVVAIGTNANATNYAGLALGLNSVTDGNSTISIGRGAETHGFEALAIGADSSADLAGTAVGAQSVATGESSTALGRLASATGTRAVAMGREASSAAEQATAIGYQANASAVNAIAIGSNARADSAEAVAIGTNATATGGRAVSIGSGNVASGNGAVAIGDPNTATGDGAIASGLDNTATGNGSVAMGNTNMVGGGGQGVSVAGTAAQGAVGIGYQNTVVGQGSVAIGSTSKALAAGAVAFGDTAVANNARDVALGSGSTTAAAVATPGTVIGGVPYNFAGTTPTSTVSVGALGAERTITNVAAGRIAIDSTDAINGSQLFGTNQQVTANTTSINNLNNTVGGINNGAGIKYFHATSTLPDSQALGTDSVAIGPNAVANNANAVALGSGSTTAAAVGTASTVIGTTPYNFAGTTPGSTVSVGAPGAERTITNVAAGRLNGASTDAVNGSQLFATNQQVTANTTQITKLSNTIGDINTGAGIKYFHANSTLPDSQAVGTNSVAIGPNAVANNAGDIALGAGSTTASAVGTASTVIGTTTYNFAGTNPLSTVSIGSVGAERTITNVAAGRLSGTSTDAINGSQLYATNQQVSTNTTNIATNTADITNLNNTIGAINGGGGIKYFHANSTLPDSQALGTDAIAVGPNAVANGIGSIAQGLGASATVDGSIALGSGSVSDRFVAGTTGDIPAGSSLIPYNTTDRILLGAVSVGSATSFRQITNVADGTQAQDAVTVRQLSGALQSFAVTPIQYFHANSTAMDSLAIGAESVAIGPRTVVNGDNGVGIGNGAVVQQTAPGGVAIGQRATSHRADSIALGTQSSAAAIQGVAIGTGTSVTQAGGVALGAGSVASTAAGAAGYVPTGASTSQIAAVQATTSTLSAVSVGDAANGQFRQINGVAAGSLDSDAVNVSQLRAVQNTVASVDQSAVKYETNADGSTNYNSVTLGGSNANAPVSLHNVADGVAGNDAVNVNQLRSASAASTAYTDARVNALGNELHGVARNAYAGVAAAMAVQMPGSYVPGKTVMRLGYGIFKGESAVGVSFRRTAENNGWSVTGGVGMSRAGPAATVGAEWVFN